MADALPGEKPLVSAWPVMAIWPVIMTKQAVAAK
jgi:hypothetical protein